MAVELEEQVKFQCAAAARSWTMGGGFAALDAAAGDWEFEKMGADAAHLKEAKLPPPDRLVELFASALRYLRPAFPRMESVAAAPADSEHMGECRSPSESPTAAPPSASAAVRRP